MGSGALQESPDIFLDGDGFGFVESLIFLFLFFEFLLLEEVAFEIVLIKAHNL